MSAFSVLIMLRSEVRFFLAQPGPTDVRIRLHLDRGRGLSEVWGKRTEAQVAVAKDEFPSLASMVCEWSQNQPLGESCIGDAEDPRECGELESFPPSPFDTGELSDFGVHDPEPRRC